MIKLWVIVGVTCATLNNNPKTATCMSANYEKIYLSELSCEKDRLGKDIFVQPNKGKCVEAMRINHGENK